MDGTFRRDGNIGEAAQQALTDFASTPAGVLVLYVQDEVFDLEWQPVGVAIRASASVREPLHAASLVTIDNLIAGLAGDAKLPAKFRHGLAGEPASHKLQPFIHYRTLLPRHHSLPFTRRKCHLCVRYNVLPMSQVAHLKLSRLQNATDLYAAGFATLAQVPNFSLNGPSPNR